MEITTVQETLDVSRIDYFDVKDICQLLQMIQFRNNMVIARRNTLNKESLNGPIQEINIDIKKILNL